MKIPFTLDAWLKDTSQKVVDEDGRPVRIICTDADGLYPIIGLVNNKTPLPCGKDGRPPYIGGGGGILFLVTTEPELSEFEKGHMRIVHKMKPEDFNDEGLKIAKKEAAELLELARKELEPKIKAEALSARATEITKNLTKSGLDNDSIPYHLIEFMCNLYTCQNWKEIEDTAELYTTRIKAAAMKDLPRWKPAARAYDGDRLPRIDCSLNRLVARFEEGIFYLDIRELYKLPGFNE